MSQPIDTMGWAITAEKSRLLKLAREALGPGWLIETDCGPCMRLVKRDASGEYLAEGVWIYPQDVGLPRYCEDFVDALGVVFAKALEVVTTARPLVAYSEADLLPVPVIGVGSLVVPRTLAGLSLSLNARPDEYDDPGPVLKGRARVAAVCDQILDWTADPDLGGYAWHRRVSLEVETAGSWAFAGWASAGALVGAE